MNQIFTGWQSTKVPILCLSLAAVLACLPLARKTIASTISGSPKQPAITTKIISLDRPLAQPSNQMPSPTVAKIPKSAVTMVTKPSVKMLKAERTATGRSLEIEEIRGTVTFKGRSAQLGDRLLAPGDEIITGSDSTARLAIDNHTGIVEVAEKTAVKISSLSDANGEKDTAIFVSRGRVRLSIGRTAATTPSTSTIIPPNQIASLNTFSGLGKFSQVAQKKGSAKTAPVRVETPEGVAGVRGTSFGVNVGPDGKTGVDTIEGSVGVSGKNDSEVIVNRGNATTIFPKTSPLVPTASPALAELKVHTLSRLSGNVYRFSGQIDPMDILYINKQAIKIDRQGKFKIQGTLPTSRRLKIMVQGPSVRERHYELAVP
jgi:FecR protein